MTTKSFDLLNDYKIEGELLPILTYPNPILTKKSIKVEKFDDELVTLAKNMLYTMYKAPGIGLAALQIGQNIRMFVLDIDYKSEKISEEKKGEEESFKLSLFKPHVFINPEIVKSEGEQTYEEGCLSLPGLYEEVKRAEKIEIRYQDLDGESHTIEATDIFAICFQHERDHLDGIVFLDHLSRLKRNFLRKKLLKKSRKEHVTSAEAHL